MTEREKEIFRWIKENPLISQQEIAERAGITRSSVAVHISNLMRKGMIQGKGYVVREEKYITVIGAVNVDISGQPERPLLGRDSNPGKIGISFGGVGRNVAENICRMGGSVEMITVLGDDFYAAEIEKECRNLGIGLGYTLRAQGENTSTYLCINHADGDMALAVSDMDIYKRLTPEYLEGLLPIINKSSLVVVDGNIPRESIEYLAEMCTVPILAEPVSVKKAERFRKVLDKLYLIKPNSLELEVLSGVKVIDEETMKEAMDILLQQGVQNLVVSRGSKGVFFGNAEGKKRYSGYPCRVVNTTGCGDALMAGIAFGLWQEATIEEAVSYGLAAASISIESTGAVSREITMEHIQKRMCSQR